MFVSLLDSFSLDNIYGLKVTGETSGDARNLIVSCLSARVTTATIGEDIIGYHRPKTAEGTSRREKHSRVKIRGE